MCEKDTIKEDAQGEDEDEDYLVEVQNASFHVRKSASIGTVDPANVVEEESETDSGDQGSEQKAASPESEAESSEAKAPEGQASEGTKASDVNTRVDTE